MTISLKKLKREVNQIIYRNGAEIDAVVADAWGQVEKAEMQNSILTKELPLLAASPNFEEAYARQPGAIKAAFHAAMERENGAKEREAEIENLKRGLRELGLQGTNVRR